MITLCDEIKSHYSANWDNLPIVRTWNKGPISELPHGFCVLEFSSTAARPMWTYATCCMSEPLDGESLELHLFSPVQSVSHVELLTVVTHYHHKGESLGLGHTVNFGRPWMAGSNCEYGLISLPYLDGPTLETFCSNKSKHVVRCLWLVPITRAERDYKKANGLEELERKFEQANFDYLDPFRQSVV